jgi:hypothetical protein
VSVVTESKTLIRRISGDEMAMILPLARDFCSRIPDCPLNEQHFVQFLKTMDFHKLAAVFIIEHDGQAVGTIGAVVSPDFLTGRKCASELFWTVNPEHRGVNSIKLLYALERWATQEGCHHLIMVHLDCSMKEELSKMYPRLGYSLFETWWRKELS